MFKSSALFFTTPCVASCSILRKAEGYADPKCILSGRRSE